MLTCVPPVSIVGDSCPKSAQQNEALRRLAALGWPDAVSSVAHVSSGYARSLRPCLGLSHRTQPGGSPFC